MTTDNLEPVSIQAETIAGRINLIRGQKVIIDSNLAALYGVETRRLNEQVRRNAGRFPPDFMFELTADEYAALMSQIATSKPGRGGRRKLPMAFTEHGALMAATLLNTPRAVEVAVYVVRAFVQLREALAGNQAMAAKLEEIEQRIELQTLKHDTLAHATRAQMKQVFDAIRALMIPAMETKKRPIGFTPPKD